MPLNKKTQQFITQVFSQPGKSITAMSIQEFRDMQAHLNKELSGAEPADVQTIEQLLDLTIKIKIHRPLNFYAGMPTLIYVPGGAFVSSGFENIAPKRMAKGCQVIVLQHRLAPENPFPASIDDIEKGLQLILKEKHLLFINEHSIFLGGDSSGANFALSAVLRLRDKNFTLPFKQLIFISPAVDLSMTPNCLEQYDREDKLFGDDVVRAVQTWYKPDGDLKNPEVSPLYHPKGFVRFPPVAIIIPEYDRLRSQAEEFKKTLLRDGIKLKEFICPGEIHASLNLRGVLNEGKDPAEYVTDIIKESTSTF